MKPFTKYCLSFLVVLISLFFSCNRHTSNANSGLKVVLDVSYKEYIKSLVLHNNDTLFDDVLANTSSTKMQYKPFFESFIDNYIQRASLQKLLVNFSGNAEIPPLHTKNELLYFLTTNFNDKLKRMDIVLKNRIKAFTGAGEEEIKITYEPKQVVILVSGDVDEKDLRSAFKNREGVQFWEAVDPNMMYPIVKSMSGSLDKLIPPHQIKTKDTTNMSLNEMIAEGEKRISSSDSLLKIINPTIDATGQSFGGSYWAVIHVEDTATFNSILKQPFVHSIVPSDIKILYGDCPGANAEQRKKIMGIYAVKTSNNDQPLVNGDDIKEAKADYINGMPEISMEMTARGTNKWSIATLRLVKKRIIIESGNYVLSAPNVNEQITGGRTSITGAFSAKEMTDLAKTINAGRFPMAFKVASIDKVK